MKNELLFLHLMPDEHINKFNENSDLGFHF